MVGTKRYLITNTIPYFLYIFCQSGKTFISYLYLSERMQGISVAHIRSEIILAYSAIPEF